MKHEGGSPPYSSAFPTSQLGTDLQLLSFDAIVSLEVGCPRGHGASRSAVHRDAGVVRLELKLGTRPGSGQDRDTSSPTATVERKSFDVRELPGFRQNPRY